MIQETIITTLNIDKTVHIAPMGIRWSNEEIIVAPFKPSATLVNLKRDGQAVVNMTDDVRIFAGCLTGRYNWPTEPAVVVTGKRLADALSHLELEVRDFEDNEQRPRFICEIVHRQIHAPFTGFNRAKAAVLEAAILVSRLDRLSQEKIDSEIDYLRIAIEKTAGEKEKEAWDWLITRIQEHRERKMADEGII